MTLQPFPLPAQQRIGLEKHGDLFRAKTLAKTIPPTGQILVKVGYVTEVLTNRLVPETTEEQPSAESIQNLPQRPGS